jgi:hypothetical protein
MKKKTWIILALQAFSISLNAQVTISKLYFSKNDSIIESEKPKILKKIKQWEKGDKTTHFIKEFEHTTTKSDCTISISSIVPKIKINIFLDTLGTGTPKFILSATNPLEFYVIPNPFSNKIYNYEIEDDYHKKECISLLGSRSSERILRLLTDNKNFANLFFGYFLENERYSNNFLVQMDSAGRITIIDENIRKYFSPQEFIKHRYGSIESLFQFLKDNSKGKSNALFFIENLKISSEIAPHIRPDHIAKYEIVSPKDPYLTIKNNWMYSVVAFITLTEGVELLDLDGLCKKYNIGFNQDYSKIKIKLDSTVLLDPSKILIDSSLILKVEVKGKSERIIFISTKLNHF